jgi:2-polyprenyl-6-methoxyphenol hydroxylase-like FAD-dependent oxidoreductase
MELSAAPLAPIAQARGEDMARSDVLIVGAGPTGLVLAIALAKLGIGVRIIDKTSQPGTTSRALAIQARTLELYRPLGLADVVTAAAHRVRAANLWARGRVAARLSFEAIGAGVTPFPFLEIYPQDQHEQMLIEHLARLGVIVERSVELLGFEDCGDHVIARLRSLARETLHEARFLAGCDGARSAVRTGVGAHFPGGTYRQLFYVADVVAGGPPINGELHVDLEEADFLAVFPLAGSGRARLIGTVRDERADRDDLRFEDVSARAIDHLGIRIERVNWFSTYHVHHRVADRFRYGCAFLLGDAAHIHSPAGGQGMNTGIGDAINLAWKLAAVLGGYAPDTLLDSYEGERIGFARRLVATTDRVFSFATANGPIADAVRTRLAPQLLARATAIAAVRQFMFRTLSQIGLNYRGQPLSVGRTGRVHGGDRLPWVDVDGRDNHASLGLRWQVHVYGATNPALTRRCAELGLPLHVFRWRPEHEKAGIARDALYLLRPDTYVALADPTADPALIDRYLRPRGLAMSPTEAG